ncbi:hypothetical protein ACJJTC_003923 [Scirpophaga incertulas]
MSYMSLAVLSLHWRNEGETRIDQFLNKCDLAINNIQRIKMRADGLKSDLNCEPPDLEEKFVKCMHQLEQFNVLITGFNISVKNLEERRLLEQNQEDHTSHVAETSPSPSPVHDNTPVMTTATAHLQPVNLMDVLSEPAPSKSSACFNQCPPQVVKPRKVPKEDQMLITFSSNSCSSESVPRNNEVTSKEVQCELLEEVKQLTIKSPAPSPLDFFKLPAQKVLDVDHVYPATITCIDEASFWVITDYIDEVFTLMSSVNEYYEHTHIDLTPEELRCLVYCCYYDVESKTYYRGMIFKIIEGDEVGAEVFLVDTGEIHTTTFANIQPLQPQFCRTPPYARCCHLAGIEFIDQQNKDLLDKQQLFLKDYIGRQCSIKVDDNSSESLGVYVILPSNVILNNLLVDEGLALSIDKPQPKKLTVKGPPELKPVSDSELDLTQCPEYEDPVEAVTGYSNRDEADICKHYKGGPSKTCFKGSRCTKKHILKHPDGWTLDRVGVVTKVRSVPLPAPGTWHKVLVTYVCHFDRVYVQFIKEKPREEIPSFGVILPPTTLEGLVRDMNSPAAKMAYKPLQLTPAPGELVAALYPPDGNWYRARVLTVTRADQNVEVFYIDYGNVMWVQEDAVRQLEARFLSLPAQAVRCVLAGVTKRSNDSKQWADAKQFLRSITEELVIDAHIMGREYDELIVELLDKDGYNVAEQLAAHGMVTLTEYSVIDDTNVTRKMVAA